MCSLHTVRAASVSVFTERTGIGYENPGIPVQRPCIHGTPVHGRGFHRMDGNRLWKTPGFPSGGRVYIEPPSTAANFTEWTGIGYENPGIPVRRPCIHGTPFTAADFTEWTGIGYENPGIPVQRPCIHGIPVHGRVFHRTDGNRLWKTPGFPSGGRVYIEPPSTAADFTERTGIGYENSRDSRPAAVYTRNPRPRPQISQNGRESVMKTPGFPSGGRVCTEIPSTAAVFTKRTGIGYENLRDSRPAAVYTRNPRPRLMYTFQILRGLCIFLFSISESPI